MPALLGKFTGEDVPREKKYDFVYYAGLAVLILVAFAQMTVLASQSSLWLDDMFQIDYCRSGSIGDVIMIDPYTPPLFNIVAWLWYRVIPFGEVWLRLLSISLVTACLPFVAACGRLLGSRRSGFLAAFMLVLNAKVITQMAMNFRAYALLLFLSCLFIFLQVRRMRMPVNELTWKSSVGLALSMLALGYTHYFGILLVVPFFFVDLYLLARGRLNGARLKVFVPYALALVFYIPWALIALKTLGHAQATAMAGEGVGHWQNGGSDANVHALLYWLCGECAEVVGLFHIAAIIVCVTALYRAFKRTFVWTEELPIVAIVLAILSVIYVISFYAEYVNPETMLMVNRYFTPFIGAIAIVCAWGVAKIFSWIPTSDPVRFAASFLCVALLISSTSATISYDMSTNTSTRFYAKLAAFLEERPDISSESTIVLANISTTDRGRQISAWEHYYFDRKDSRDFKISIYDGLDPSVMLNPYDLLRYDTIYMTCQHLNYEIPELYRSALGTYFNAFAVREDGALEPIYVGAKMEWPPDGPGGGKTFKFTKIDTTSTE